MPRKLPLANEPGAISVTPHFIDDDGQERPVPPELRPMFPAAAISRWRVRSYLRLADQTRRNLTTGAYALGARIELMFWADTADALTNTRRMVEVARRRVQEEANKAYEEVLDVEEAAEEIDAGRVVAALCSRLLDEAIESGQIAYTSGRSYRSALRAIERSPLGAMQSSDVLPRDISDFLLATATPSVPFLNGKVKSGGPASAKMARSLLNRAFDHAVQNQWLTVHPVKNVGRIRLPRQPVDMEVVGLDKSRALSIAEQLELSWFVCRDERSVELGLRDLILAGTAIGGRIGEVCAIRWCDITITRNRATRALSATVALTATSGRVAGEKGASRQPMKTRPSVRTIPVPRRVAALLARRARDAGVHESEMPFSLQPVFPAPGRWESPTAKRKFRDTTNTTRRLREAFDRAGYNWLSFHGLRRTAVTRLTDVLPIRQAADFAGHSSIRTTLDAYVARTTVNPDVAKYL